MTCTKLYVLQLRLQYPGWTLAEIAEATGVSRQYVHQVLKAEAWQTKRDTMQSRMRESWERRWRKIEGSVHPD